MGIFEKISEGLKKTRDSILGSLNRLFGNFSKIDEEFFESLEETLIMCDIGVQTSVDICDELRKKVKADNISAPDDIRNALKDIIAEMLGEDKPLDLSTKPSVILVIGVNGAGKTTTIGKLASQIKNSGKSVIVAAADTFRAAAIDQLEVWAERAGADIIKHEEGSDPASVVFDAVSAAKARGTDVVICDTAGRLHNKKNLMEELKKITRICYQQAEGCSVETLLVLDATTGQNAVNQAKLFSQTADITGIVLTKLDGTAKGGIVISIHRELGIPVKLVGVGEKLEDLQPFNARDFAEALFDTNTDFEGNYERLTDDETEDENIITDKELEELSLDEKAEETSEEIPAAIPDEDEADEIPAGSEPVPDPETEPGPDVPEETAQPENAEEEPPQNDDITEEPPAAEEEKDKKKSLKDGKFGFLFKEITFGKKKKDTDDKNNEDEEQ